MPGRCLVHLASGVGNIVFATPLLIALDELGYEVHVCLDADYAQTADLLQPWSVVRAVHGGGLAAMLRSLRAPKGNGGWDAVVPAVPPFYWPRFARAYDGPVAEVVGRSRVVPRPSERVFARDEQAFYLAFAHARGYPADVRPAPYLPIGARGDETRVGAQTVVLAPGCKTGVMWQADRILCRRYLAGFAERTRFDERRGRGRWIGVSTVPREHGRGRRNGNDPPGAAALGGGRDAFRECDARFRIHRCRSHLRRGAVRYRRLAPEGQARWRSGRPRLEYLWVCATGRDLNARP